MQPCIAGTTLKLHKVLHRCLSLQAQKIQTVQDLKPSDYPLCSAFLRDILERLDEDNRFLKRVVYLLLCYWYILTDEAACHVSGSVSRHSVRIYGSDRLHVLLALSDPVCRRALPVSMNFLCHSHIGGVLEGKSKLY